MAGPRLSYQHLPVHTAKPMQDLLYPLGQNTNIFTEQDIITMHSFFLSFLLITSTFMLYFLVGSSHMWLTKVASIHRLQEYITLKYLVYTNKSFITCQLVKHILVYVTNVLTVRNFLSRSYTANPT